MTESRKGRIKGKYKFVKREIETHRQKQRAAMFQSQKEKKKTVVNLIIFKESNIHRILVL